MITEHTHTVSLQLTIYDLAIVEVGALKPGIVEVPKTWQMGDERDVHGIMGRGRPPTGVGDNVKINKFAEDLGMQTRTTAREAILGGLGLFRHDGNGIVHPGTGGLVAIKDVGNGEHGEDGFRNCTGKDGQIRTKHGQIRSLLGVGLDLHLPIESRSTGGDAIATLGLPVLASLVGQDRNEDSGDVGWHSRTEGGKMIAR
mmetsp:Transcript_17076/g.37033  ORF Transcript_17076/g.37033 Transcript_17076/m.37033 type:complete len:200 (-) Transcript_17076:34-633(-)